LSRRGACILISSLITLAVIAGTVATAANGGVAGAQEISVTRLQRDIAENSRRIDELARQIDDATRRERALNAEIAATQARIETTRFFAANIKAQVQERAAHLYTAGRVNKGPALNLRHIADAASAQHYGDGVAQADDLLLHKLVDITEGLEADTRKLEADRAEAEAQRQAAIAAKAAVEDLLSRQKKLLAALDVIPVMGTSQLTTKQMADWFESTGMPYRLSGGMSIRELAQIFLEEGADEDVRGDVAFAQSVLETGYFRYALDNNYAGLGACDSCAGEPGFPSPRDGVRAQIQHLKNYGDPDSRTPGLAHPPSPTWYGADPAVAARNFDTFFAKGRAQTWQVMGRGNWATDPNYSAKVIGIYIRMVVYAADHL
jgi:flagellum-specific peptidoglycan hydrolase FlgJ